MSKAKRIDPLVRRRCAPRLRMHPQCRVHITHPSIQSKSNRVKKSVWFICAKIKKKTTCLTLYRKTRRLFGRLKTYTTSEQAWSSSFHFIMSLNQIPPVKGKDNQTNFVGTFFKRLLNLNIVSDSETIKRFITEVKYKKEKIDSKDADREVR